MKFIQIILTAFLLIPNCFAYSPEQLPASVQQPQGKTLELTSFKPQLINFPFTIKYPKAWYAREEISGAQALFLTREPVLKTEDRYRVGVGIYYLENFFLRKAPETSEWSGKAQAVYLVPDWKEQKRTFVDSMQQRGTKIFSSSDLEISGYPALKIEFQTKDSLVTTYYIKIDFNLISVTCEAPQIEFDKYKELFASIMSSLQITK